MEHTSMDRTASQTYVNLAEVAIRNTAAMMEMQIGMARHLAEIQVRSARLFGVPDYTEVLDASVDGSRRLVSLAADQVLHTTQRINETMTDLQNHLARMMQQQARSMTDEMCRNIGDIGGDAEHAVRTAVQQMSRSVQEVERVATEARRQGSAILRPDEATEATKRRETATK
jgi:hypothetical protein